MTPSVTPSKREANESLLDNLSKAQASSKYTDLTLKCEEKEFKVHRLVVCGWSPVIANACDGRFEESETGVVNVSIATAPAVERMVDFMYGADYNDGADAVLDNHLLNDERATIDKPDATMIANIEVYVLADYYRIESLKKLATEKFEAACSRPFSKEGILATAQEVYSSSHAPLTDLRSIIASRAASAGLRDVLLEDSSFMADAEELDGFVGDVARSVNQKYRRSMYQCMGHLRDAIHTAANVRVAMGTKLESERKKLREMQNRLTVVVEECMPGKNQTTQSENDQKDQ